MLTIVATPIGNLKDITLRALETIKSCDGIICEDSRRTAILLNHFEIKKPMIVLNDFNEEKNTPMIIQKLSEDKNFCLVSDAGTPLVSDPGYKLVRECLYQNIAVDSLPGSSAVITALTLSGLPPDKFLFLGYLPEKEGKRKVLLEKIKTIDQIIKNTYIIFVSPYKLIKTLVNMEQVFGDIQVVLAKELTKIHQAVENKQISSWLELFKKQTQKGEIVMLFRL